MRKKTARKEKFILRPDLMSPIRKTSLLYVRVIFIRAICCSLLVETVFVVYMKRVPELISPQKRKKKVTLSVALRLSLSHSLPQFEGTTWNCLINNLFMWLLLFCRRIFPLIMTDKVRWGDRECKRVTQYRLVCWRCSHDEISTSLSRYLRERQLNSKVT